MDTIDLRSAGLSAILTEADRRPDSTGAAAAFAIMAFFACLTGVLVGALLF